MESWQQAFAPQKFYLDLNCIPVQAGARSRAPVDLHAVAVVVLASTARGPAAKMAVTTIHIEIILIPMTILAISLRS